MFVPKPSQMAIDTSKTICWYLDAISEDGRGHLEEQCQHQHPNSPDATAVQQSTARVCAATIACHRPLIRTSHSQPHILHHHDRKVRQQSFKRTGSSSASIWNL